MPFPEPHLPSPTSTAGPTRIALCITELDPGGAENALATLARGLDRTAWEPHLYCVGPDTPLAEAVRKDGIPVTCLGARSWRDAGLIVRLTRELRRFRPALLQTFLFHGNLAGRIAGWRAGVPVIVSGIRVADGEHPWHVRLERWTRRFVSHHVCVSEGVAEFVAREMQVPRSEMSVIPNGVDTRRFAAAEPVHWSDLGLPADAEVLLNVGRLTPQKGQDLLIRSFANLRSERQHLVIVGDGALERSLKELTRQLAVEDRVHLVGRRNDVPTLLAGARGFVLSSHWEGMPNVVLEAMAAGCPVVATDVEGVRELLGENVRGLVVPPNDSAVLAAALQGLLAERLKAEARAAAARDWVASEMTPERMVERYDALYRRLLGLG